MMDAILIEMTSKRIKYAELIVLLVLFASIAAGLGLLYLWIPLGLSMFGITGLSLLAFCYVRIWRWWMHG